MGSYTVDTTQFVDEYFLMDPATDDLIFDGTNLRNGMVVLLENNSFRTDPSQVGSMDGGDRDRLYRYNRWAKVSHLVINMDRTSFMATYGDGSKRKIDVQTSHAWYVKKDSMPVDDAVPGQISLPVVEFQYNQGHFPQNVLTPESVSYSPFDRRRPEVATGSAPVREKKPSDTGFIPRVPWAKQDEANIEEPSHFNQTRESWEQNRGGAPIN